MIDGHVFLDASGDWMVSLRVAGEEFDLAGPFDDETDALLMAQRNADNVHVQHKPLTLGRESSVEQLEAA